MEEKSMNNIFYLDDSPEAESATFYSSTSSFEKLDSYSTLEANNSMELEDCAMARPLSGGSFLGFRLSYLLVTLVVMLADGLQGTHLYVLYESYGFSVASLYSMGFFVGAITTPITSPLIDKIGRKKAALIYCALEMLINQLEQFPFLSGLLISRAVGGVTTNLLAIVFEAWVDTEHRVSGLTKENYEVLMRDKTIVSNFAAIASGYLAHILANKLGPAGPFEGAVTCTGIAFGIIFFLWSENYGMAGSDDKKNSSFIVELKDTFHFIKSDSRVLRVCISQGLSLAVLHIFIFLWSPLLKDFATEACSRGRIQLWGIDERNEPAYGLIFGAFMAAGVLGGYCSPLCRKFLSHFLSPVAKPPDDALAFDEFDTRRMDVELQVVLCYFCASMSLIAPCLLSAAETNRFGIALASFIAYEFVVGTYSPSEGVIRSIYIPSSRRGSVMAVPTIIVNVAVVFAVISTESVPKQTVLSFASFLLSLAGFLQFSIMSKSDRSCILHYMNLVIRSSLSTFSVILCSPKQLASSAAEILFMEYSLAESEKED
jgi:MFS family permease